jgi:hypothetical protein
MVKAIEDLFKDRTRTTNRIEALKQYPEEYNKILAWPPKSGQFVLKFYIMPFYASH